MSRRKAFLVEQLPRGRWAWNTDLFRIRLGYFRAAQEVDERFRLGGVLELLGL
jgi:hypothetical protein